MSLKIKRRKFGQLVISGAAVTVLANIPGKSNAVTSEEIIYGVTLSGANAVGNNTTSNTTSNTANAIPVGSDAANTTPTVTIVASGVTSGTETSRVAIASSGVDNKSTTTKNASKALFTQPTERITTLAALPNGMFAIASVSSTKNGNFTRLIITDGKAKQKALKVSGFQRPNSTLESLLVQGKQVLGIISLSEGIPPFNLVNLDLNSATVQAKSDATLPQLRYERRYSNLVLSPDGKIYATSLGQEGSTVLLQIDLTNLSPLTGKGKISQVALLSFKKQELENDLSGLAISPSGQIYALADPAKEGTNSLFTVDVKSGEMQLIRKFPVDKIAFARA